MAKAEPIDKRFRAWSNKLIELKMSLEALEADDYGIRSNSDFGEIGRVSGTGGGTTLTPTEAAVQHKLYGQSASKQTREALDRLVKRIGTLVDKFVERNEKWIHGGELVEAPDLWCESHKRFELYEPRHRGDLCRRCYDYARANGNRWPKKALLALWDAGKRVTQAEYDKAEA